MSDGQGGPGPEVASGLAGAAPTSLAARQALVVTTDDAASPAAPVRRSSHRALYVVVLLSLFMGTLDTTIVATALPAIHSGLHASLNWVGWTLTVYSLGSIVVLPVAGRVSDRLGRRETFALGIALFTASSLMCGLSTSIYMLIAFRALQALGGGLIQPSAAAVVVDNFGANRDRALGLFWTMFATGQMAGPVVGGVLVGYLSWRWIFFVNVPVGVVLVVLALRLVPRSRRRPGERTDLLGIAQVVGFAFAAVVAITEVGDRGTSLADPSFLVPALVAAAIAAAFVYHTVRSVSPLIPPQLLAGRGFGAGNLLSFLWGGLGFGMAALVPLYAEQRYHLPAVAAGTLLTGRAIAALVVSGVSTMMLRRVGYRVPMIVGYLLTGVGALLLSISPAWAISPYAWLAVAAGFTGLGNGCANPALQNAVLHQAPDQVAAVTGLRAMFNYLGSTAGIAVMTAILNRSSDPGLAQAHLQWASLVALVVVMVPISFRVPEHRGGW